MPTDLLVAKGAAQDRTRSFIPLGWKARFSPPPGPTTLGLVLSCLRPGARRSLLVTGSTPARVSGAGTFRPQLPVLHPSEYCK